jgi:hypothetical protein
MTMAQLLISRESDVNPAPAWQRVWASPPFCIQHNFQAACRRTRHFRADTALAVNKINLSVGDLVSGNRPVFRRCHSINQVRSNTDLIR